MPKGIPRDLAGRRIRRDVQRRRISEQMQLSTSKTTQKTGKPQTVVVILRFGAFPCSVMAYLPAESSILDRFQVSRRNKLHEFSHGRCDDSTLPIAEDLLPLDRR